MGGWQVQMKYDAPEGTHILTCHVANPHQPSAIALAINEDARWQRRTADIRLAKQLTQADIVGYEPDEGRRVHYRLA